MSNFQRAKHGDLTKSFEQVELLATWDFTNKHWDFTQRWGIAGLLS